MYNLAEIAKKCKSTSRKSNICYMRKYTYTNTQKLYRKHIYKDNDIYATKYDEIYHTFY